MVDDDLDARLAAVLSEWVQAQLSIAKSQIAAAEADRDSMRRERDEAVRIAEACRVLVDAARQWHKDNYSPRLRNAIDVFLRQEIARR